VKPELSISIVWDEGEADAPSVEEIEQLLSELDALLQDLQAHDEADDA